MRTRLPLLILSCALLLPASAVAAPAPGTSPDGFRIIDRARLDRGVVHLTMRSDDVVAHVARIGARAPVALRTISAGGAVGTGRLERTSAMCRRVRCEVAVNGDFFRSNIPVGAVAERGSLVRSPNRSHHQLIIDRDGRLQAGNLAWKGKLVPTDLDALRLRGLNRPRGRNDLILYTRDFGSSTGTNRFGTELVIRFLRPRRVPLVSGQTVVVRLVALRSGRGDLRIPERGGVLSGHGEAAAALRDLWARARTGEVSRQALLRVETEPDVLATIGGTPILLRDGRVWFSNANNDFVRGRHPRTVVGWNRRGDTWLVTVDGRQAGYSDGFTLAEAARFMLDLGATDAINLDGGGSSTFVVEGDVVNRPSDRAVSSGGRMRILRSVAPGVRAANVERPVANALVVVPLERGSARARTQPPLRLNIPREVVPGPSPVESDPASNPDAALPAIVAAPVAPSSEPGLPVAPVATAAGLLAVSSASLGSYARGRSLRTRRARAG